jgi:hypothetical protein
MRDEQTEKAAFELPGVKLVTKAIPHRGTRYNDCYR